MNAATIRLDSLRELWIHTGTACNLECPFCLEASKPGDMRLQKITLSEIKPHLDAAVDCGVQRFVFTGGEPLIVKDIVKILEYALQLKPCLVFTNGTAPLLKRVHQLELLKQQPHPLSFRVSIDFADEQRHDAGRGWGNFKRAIEGLKVLHRAGFIVSLARHQDEGEISAEVDACFRELLRKHQLPATMDIIALPDFGRPGVVVEESIDAAMLCAKKTMCSYSRMLLKREGTLRISACALVDDDVSFEIAANLQVSIAAITTLRHARCLQCVKQGASLS